MTSWTVMLVGCVVDWYVVAFEIASRDRADCFALLVFFLNASPLSYCPTGRISSGASWRAHEYCISLLNLISVALLMHCLCRFFRFF